MHNIEYYEYDENIKRDWVQAKLDDYVAHEDWQEGCTGLGKPIRWLEHVGICADREEAESVIEDHDRKWYDQLAVRFYQPQRTFKDAKMQEYERKTIAAFDAYRAEDDVWAHGIKAEFVGCKKCGSKLKRLYIKTNRCPVCGTDLRPESTLKAVQSAKSRWIKAQAAENKYRSDHAKKTVRWLVKIEYHT